MLVFSFVQWCVHRPRGIIAIELDEVVISRPRTAWPLTYVYSVVHMRKGAPAISYINDIAGMIPAGSRVLLLGLGGGGLPYEMRSRGVDIHLTAVDVDPDALVIARRVVPDGGNWAYVVSSAREAVASAAPDSYDVIINDLYMGTRMPPEALTHTFTEGVMRALTPGGVYLTNCVSVCRLPGVHTDLWWETGLEEVVSRLCIDAGFIDVQKQKSMNTLVIARKG